MAKNLSKAFQGLFDVVKTLEHCEDAALFQKSFDGFGQSDQPEVAAPVAQTSHPSQTYAQSGRVHPYDLR